MRLDEVNAESLEMGFASTSVMLDDLSCLFEYTEARKLKNSLTSLFHSRAIMKLLEKSIAMLKKYPDNGVLYYNILHATYLRQEKTCEFTIINELHIGRSTYYKLKKDAIELLGVMLWGFFIPSK